MMSNFIDRISELLKEKPPQQKKVTAIQSFSVHPLTTHAADVRESRHTIMWSDVGRSPQTVIHCKGGAS